MFDNKIELGKCEKNNTSHTNKGGVYMATSSITKNFVISGQKQVEMFVDAIEASANNRPIRIPVAARELTDTDDIIKLMEKRKKANVAK